MKAETPPEAALAQIDDLERRVLSLSRNLSDINDPGARDLLDCMKSMRLLLEVALKNKSAKDPSQRDAWNAVFRRMNEVRETMLKAFPFIPADRLVKFPV